jgi:hypothetical protein
MKTKSHKVEDNGQIEAELVLTAALTAASRAAGRPRQKFHSTQLKENQFLALFGRYNRSKRRVIVAD